MSSRSLHQLAVFSIALLPLVGTFGERSTRAPEAFGPPVATAVTTNLLWTVIDHNDVDRTVVPTHFERDPQSVLNSDGFFDTTEPPEDDSVQRIPVGRVAYDHGKTLSHCDRALVQPHLRGFDVLRE